jgi:hypothetical protein
MSPCQQISILTEEQPVRPIHAINTGIMDNHKAKTIWAINRLNFSRDFNDRFESIIYPNGFNTALSESHLIKRSNEK